MKRIHHYIFLLFTLVFSSCDKDNLPSIPLEKSFEDPAKALDSYKESLLGSEFGWELSLSGSKQHFHAGYIDFSSDKEAVFTVDEMALADQVPSPTTVDFRVKQTNAGLSFSGGSYTTFALGKSVLDTAFTFQAIRQDSIFLLGNDYGTQMILTKATAKKKTAYFGSGVVDVQHSLVELNSLPKYFKSISVNGAGYDLHFDLPKRTLYIHYGGQDRFKIHETLFAPTATGIQLQKPLVDGVTKITAIDDFQVNAAQDKLFCTVNSMSANLRNSYQPTAYDIGAALYFYQNPFYMNSNTGDRYSASLNGFTVAGIADGYGIGNLPGYSFMLFFHEIQEGFGALTYYLTTGAAGYGTIVYRQLSPSGMIRFMYVQGLDNAPPEGYAAIVNQTEKVFTDEEGFLVIKVGPNAYDLVSANVTDGQKWIRFE